MARDTRRKGGRHHRRPYATLGSAQDHPQFGGHQGALADQTVERWDGVGVSILYLCPSASTVNRKTWLRMGWMSVIFDSNGPIGMETSWVLKLSDFAAS